MTRVSKYYTKNNINFINLKYSGIYRITNTINNKCYIGSSKNIQRRFYAHLSDFNKDNSHCIILKRAVQKYGQENFEFEILAKCPEQYLIKLEQWFIDNLKPEYNARKIADSNKGCKRSEKAIKENSERGIKRWKNADYKNHMISQMKKKFMEKRF